MIVGRRPPKHIGKRKETPPATGLPKVKARRVKHESGRMNKLERRYSRHLDALKAKGEILEWRFEPFSIRLATRTHYRPDFLVITADGFMDIHEVKGHWEDDARVKFKAVAVLHPWFNFIAITRDRKTHSWVYEHLTVEDIPNDARPEEAAPTDTQPDSPAAVDQLRSHPGRSSPRKRRTPAHGGDAPHGNR